MFRFFWPKPTVSFYRATSILTRHPHFDEPTVCCQHWFSPTKTQSRQDTLTSGRFWKKQSLLFFSEIRGLNLDWGFVFCSSIFGIREYPEILGIHEIQEIPESEGHLRKLATHVESYYQELHFIWFSYDFIWCSYEFLCFSYDLMRFSSDFIRFSYDFI